MQEKEAAPERAKKVSGLIKKIAVGVITVLIFAFIGALIYRIVQADAKPYRALLEDDVLKTAIAEGGEIRENDVRDIIAEHGEFSAYGVSYEPKSGWLQVTVRCNKSYVDRFAPSGFKDFTFTLSSVKMDETTGTDVERYGTYDPVTDTENEKYMYRYRTLVFHNVAINEDATLYLTLTDPDGGTAILHIQYPYDRTEKRP